MTTSSQPRHRSVSVLSSQLTVTISVTLVLLLLGIGALIGIGAHNVAESIRERVGFVAILNDNATAADINGLKRQWIRSPFAASVRYCPAEEVLARWNTMIPGEDSDEEALLGMNPFFAEFEVNVRSEYANADSLAVIVAEVEQHPAVRHVTLHSEMIDTLTSSINTVFAFLTAIAAAILLIAIVLIFNTVRLTIYSRRFTIRTMQLVGATDGFIRRPIVMAGALHGLVAAMIAIAILCGLVYSSAILYPEIENQTTWNDVIWVCGGQVVCGVLICGLSSFAATTRYLRCDYDSMFR